MNNPALDGGNFPSEFQLRLKSTANLLKTGHCAPAVMRTLMEMHGADPDALVRLTSGMGGGLGNTRSECGCITAPLLFLGLKQGRKTGPDGIPKVISLGRKYMDHFGQSRKGILCREILINEKNVLPCLGAITRAPGLVAALENHGRPNHGPTIDAQTAEACTALPAAFDRQDFHCVHSVFSGLDELFHADEDILPATWGFLGGTALKGMTCGALTAGVLALGQTFGAVGDRPLRVAKMAVLMALGADAMDERMNAFNSALNISQDLALWFEEAYGSTQCQEICRADLSTPEGVAQYLSQQRIDRCRKVTAEAAEKVRGMIKGV